MGEIILRSVVESIAGHLLALLSEEIGLERGVRLELQRLQDTVSIIGAVLREVEKRQVEAEDVKEWLKRLRDAAYDADDLLEDFSTEAKRRGRGCQRIANEVRIFFSSSNQLIYANKMARGVMEIKERIDAILNDRVRFQLEGSSSHFGSLVENRVRPETYPSDPEPYVIGRDKDKKEVIDFLLNPDFEKDVSILPIVGLGGMGKTTLARSVFNDRRVSEYFELKIWICVSTNFDVEDILRKMVRECGTNIEQLENANMNQSADKDRRNLNKELAKLDMNQLQKMLGARLDRKRFFIVLDDIWNENRLEWLKLQDSLINGAKGSKILVTTRDPQVARTMATTFHSLSGLPEKESLSLLMRMAMKEEDEWRDQNLVKIALAILKKCVGVPLAIMTIGRLLFLSGNTKEDWSKFISNDLSRINQEEFDIMPSLKLSYDFLPSHWKQCFSYCSLFPKDHELDPFDLIHLWMAQGFIKSSGNGKTLEEVGRECFIELVSKSFFQDLKQDICGNIIGCKLNGLMHDLAVLVMGDNYICNSSDLRYNSEARHVSMVDLEENGLKRHTMNRRRRSLFLTRFKASHLDISRFENLRVLRVQGNINSISSSIGKLKHMRSLDLSENEMLRSLPNSISKLYNLETLNLMKCYNLERLPRGITKLVNLRRLDVRGCNKLTHMPRGIGKLTNLQMLHRFVVGKTANRKAARLHELSRLTGLREGMVIGHLERLESISSEVDAPFSIEKFALQCLELQWECVDKEYTVNHEAVLDRFVPHPDLKALGIVGYGGTGLSSWISQLDKLVKINISYCNQCTRLPPMDQLPLLKMISLNELRELEWIELSKNGTPQHSFFPSLEVLEFKYLVNFKGWERRRGKEEIQDDEVSSSLCMLSTFSDKITLNIEYCPKFSYMHGQKRLHLAGITSKLLQEFSRNSTRALSDPSMTMFISISSISVSALTSLSFYEIKDVKHLPVDLFRCLQNLRSLIISRCPRLKSLRIGAIFRYLVALEILEIRDFPLLDLSINDSDGGKDMDNLQTHGHCKLNCLTIKGIWKMQSLPGWLLYLRNLKSLEISYCFSLKSLPRRLICRLLTTLESLVLKYCPELDLTGESKDQEDNLNLQFFGQTRLRELELCFIQKMKLLPWWIQHLTNLESLRLHNCNNLDLTAEIVDVVDAANWQFWGPVKLSRLEFGSMEKMKTIPWWVRYLTKLENLKLVGCRNLEALPEWFPQLKSLKRLTVLDCGELSNRCQIYKEDWYKIYDIPYVYINQQSGEEEPQCLLQR